MTHVILSDIHCIILFHEIHTMKLTKVISEVRSDHASPLSDSGSPCSSDGGNHCPPAAVAATATAAPPHSRQNSGTAANYSAVTMPGVHETNCDFKLIVDDIKNSDQVTICTRNMSHIIVFRKKILISHVRSI